MEKVPEDKQPDAALFLSGCFSLPPASTKGIAASGPIALLSDLEKSQAEAIVKELSPSLPPGVVLRIAGPEGKTRISRLQWPRPPRIYGSSVEEYLSSADTQDFACPHCGEPIRVTQDGSGLQVTALPSDTAGTLDTAESSDEPAKRRISETAIHAAPTQSDKDPLFSGIKPLDPDATKYASIRSLQAGDTGFWMDYSHNVFSPPPPLETKELNRHGGTSNAKKGTGKISAGLAAFMKSGAYALVVGRTKDTQAVKMIAEILGISEAEARDRALNLSLCVARDISLGEAQNLLARFQNLGAKARIVRPS